jgi:hypothetical protein
MPACALWTAAQFQPLVQIRRAYEADYFAVRLSVHADAGSWAVRVSDGRGETLYAAQRSSLFTAKTAAAEFALWSCGAPGQGCPEATARQLTWRERW